MLGGQNLKVFTDHKKLIQDALGLTCDRVYCWRLLLEDYDPDIVYLEGHTNGVADATCCLEFDNTVHTKYVNMHQLQRLVAILLCSYT